MAESNTQTPENKTQQEVIAEFENLRKNQRQLHSKLIKSELELKDYGVVAKILGGCPLDRKCYHLTEDHLIEYKVENILPLFATEKAKVEDRLEKLRQTIHVCAQEIKEFQKSHHINLRKDIKMDFEEDDANASPPAPSPGGSGSK